MRVGGSKPHSRSCLRVRAPTCVRCKCGPAATPLATPLATDAGPAPQQVCNGLQRAHQDAFLSALYSDLELNNTTLLMARRMARVPRDLSRESNHTAAPRHAQPPCARCFAMQPPDGFSYSRSQTLLCTMLCHASSIWQKRRRRQPRWRYELPHEHLRVSWCVCLYACVRARVPWNDSKTPPPPPPPCLNAATIIRTAGHVFVFCRTGRAEDTLPPAPVRVSCSPPRTRLTRSRMKRRIQ